MTSSAEQSPKRHPLRGRRLVILIAAVAVVVYALVVLLYGLSGRLPDDPAAQQPDKGSVTILITPQTVDAVGERTTAQVALDPSLDLRNSDGLTLSNDITLAILTDNASQTIVFPRNTTPELHSVTVSSPGAIENWPFDTYDSTIYVRAFVTENGVERNLLAKIFVTGYMPGWSLNPSAGQVLLGSGAGTVFYFVDIAASRSWSTLAFGTLLLGLMVVIAGLVLYVAISVYRGRRKVEASFMSWMGAMLFATIPLRAFLPGSPPIGSWIDFLLVLWVIVGLVTGLAIYIAAWRRWGSPPDQQSAAAGRGSEAR